MTRNDFEPKPYVKPFKNFFLFKGVLTEFNPVTDYDTLPYCRVVPNDDAWGYGQYKQVPCQWKQMFVPWGTKGHGFCVWIDENDPQLQED